jgi:natural product precursor
MQKTTTDRMLKKLALNKLTVRELTVKELKTIAGGLCCHNGTSASHNGGGGTNC